MKHVKNKSKLSLLINEKLWSPGHIVELSDYDADSLPEGDFEIVASEVSEPLEIKEENVKKEGV